jgi:hypothetical protein
LPRECIKSVTREIGLGGAIALPAYLLAIRPWMLKWGATEAEVNGAWPGDDIVPQPKMQQTHAITINASADKVWPWLVQMGQGRGGLYSYDWLENLVGCDIHSASRIVPELQTPQVGDQVRLTPEGTAGPFFVIAVIEPDNALVLKTPEDRETSFAKGYPYGSWAFILRPIDDRSTRLIVRFRSDYKPSLPGFLFGKVMLEPIQFIMEQKMMRGIKERAERK